MTMALKNEAPIICNALQIIDTAKRITRGWPKDFETMPTLAVSEAGNTVADTRDDREYASELVYDIRIFATTSQEKDEIAPLVEEVMEALGYGRVNVYDDDTAAVRMKMMRYRRYA